LLAEKFGVSVKDILKASGKKAIPASAAIDILEKKAASYGDKLSRMDATFNEQIGDTILLLKLHAASFGDAFSKMLGFNGGVKELNDWLKSSLDKSKEFYAEHQGIIKLIAGFAAFLIVLTPIAMIVSTISSVMGFLSTVAAGAGVALSVIVTITSALGIGITALIAAIIFVIYKWDYFQAFFIKTWDAILAKIKYAKDTVSSMFGFGKETFKYIFGIDSTNTSSANVDINLNAPKGTVASARSNSKSPNLNVGLNMATSK
ncbi:MAG TPA: hypothetical protein PLD02_12950, partial [Saprospiraceae bacterium]|nr:hypothetical protein [Saprospiraceae bacterium]